MKHDSSRKRDSKKKNENSRGHDGDRTHGIKAHNHIEHQLLSELIRELSEFNRNIRNGHGLRRDSHSGHFFYAHNLFAGHDDEAYRRHTRLVDSIHDVLSECRINIRSKGYSYIKDAICLLSDHNSLDVCLNSDIYPYIAEMHKISGISRIEHSIRNAISAAYRSIHHADEDHHSILHHFRSRPSNKVFLLHATQEVNGRAWNDICP